MMNGKEYLESLRDGRTVLLNGDKVDDETTHPAYRNSARSIAQLYDALHDPDTAWILTAKIDEGHTTHKFFKASKNATELFEAKDATQWSKLSYGFMGRTPDYKAAFTGHWDFIAIFIRDLKIMRKDGMKKPQGSSLL